MTRPTFVHINQTALRYNAQRVRSVAPGKKIIAMVKANAYGHGLNTIAETLHDSVDAFGVACLSEAMRIRNAGVQTPVLLMQGFFSDDELSVAVDQNFHVVIHSENQLQRFLQAKLTKPLAVWLKINTGMNRLGVPTEAVQAAYAALSACSHVKPLRLMTHFANADDPADPSTQQQFDRFTRVTKKYSDETSLGNSATILAWPDFAGDWVRPGIMLFGVSPLIKHTGQDHDLKPVMTLRSRLMSIQAAQKGDRIGYGGVWTCPNAMKIGIVAIGYGDGYPRHAPSGTPVLVNGQRVPLVGRVSMDMLAVDLSGIPAAKVGDSVTLWGDGLPVEVIAEQAGTIAYELLCSLTRRVEVIVEK